MNKAIIFGRVGQDPVKNNGTIKFSIATTEKYTDKQGDKQEVTQWHNCVSFGKQAEILEKYVKKGDQILIEGKITYNKHEDKIYTSIIINSFNFISNGKQ